MTDELSNAFFLSGSTWQKLGSVPLKHVSVGPAGLWGVSPLNGVYKYVAGDFVPVNGLNLKQVDAGGDGQIVGVTRTDSIHCLNSNIASSYHRRDSVSWTNLPGGLKFFSCGLNVCWGTSGIEEIFFTKATPTTCETTGWVKIPGSAKMVEVGNDGSVFVVNAKGQLFQRTGISSSVPQGTAWAMIPMCLPIQHATYDLGRLWLVTEGGIILQCVQ
ncbi:fish-egg lectin-like isoform X2 [Kryptolebias marmoratus]|nr:fish-egg lectin-like isoform X2 [Kryptolebias marmoratus]